MSIVSDIFDRMGGGAKIAAALRISPQTVHSWKANGKVPEWRRAPLLGAASELGVQLDPEHVSYLSGAEPRQ